MTKDKYIGFDMACKKTIACVVQQGEKDAYCTLNTDVQQMQKYLQNLREDGSKLHLTFEISGQAAYYYDCLEDYVDTLTVSNPHALTWIYRTRKKNDRLDARKQAVLLSISEIPKVHIPGKEVRQWRITIQHRHRIVGRIVSMKNSIRALIKNHGFFRPEHQGSWWKKVNVQWMRDLSEVDEITAEQLWRLQLSDLLDTLELLQGQLCKVTDYLDQYLTRQPGGKLLMSIPGVGPRTAEAILAYTDEIGRFNRTKQYCAYFGLTPRLDESGDVRRLGHISKQGPSVARAFLVESAWRAIKGSPGLKAFYERLVGGQKNQKKRAIVAVARKLLCIMRAMLLTGELFNESLIGSGDYQGVPKAA